jgi:NAD(P)-dependent dehydrogenase (short-subunit alcohol dehydrogenase family)
MFPSLARGQPRAKRLVPGACRFPPVACKLGHVVEQRENDNRERWAVILGASSGFGAATGRSLANAGYGIVGVHLDLRGTIANAHAVRDEIAAMGGPGVAFHNMNAADEGKRHQVIEATKQLFEERRGQGHDPFVAVMVHSLAFGTTLSYIAQSDGDREVSQKQLEMTADVMAHSLVYWVRDLFTAGLLADGSRIFAMTSEGATKAVPTYGPVSAAKAALEAHVRQLALELILHGITVNAIRAGVTDTPALRRIPGHEELRAVAEARNPGGRLTRPEDVGEAIVALASPKLYWMTGNTIGVDGGELMGARRVG